MTAPAQPASVTLDVTTVTLGELSDLEMESGSDFFALLKAGRTSRILLALWLTEHRRASASSEPRRSWRELSNLPAIGAVSSISPSSPDGVSVTSEP